MKHTAAQLINRVGRRLRDEDVSQAEGNDRALAILDLVNESAREVLDQQDWDFDVRHDGVLTTVAMSEEASLASGLNATIFLGGNSASQFRGRHQAKLQVDTDLGGLGSAALRVQRAYTSGFGDIYWVDQVLPFTENIVTSGRVFVNEYLLPDTVKDVISVSFQDQDVDCTFVDRTKPFRGMAIRPHEDMGDVPERVYVGGQSVATTDENSEAETGLGILITPTPVSSYRLDYSYRLKHPTVSDTVPLEGVPENVVDQIIDLAFSRASRTLVQNSIKLAEAAERAGRAGVARLQAQDDPAPNQRMRMGSHDQRSAGIPLSAGPANRRIFHEE